MTLYWALSRLYGEESSLWHSSLPASQVSLILCVNGNCVWKSNANEIVVLKMCSSLAILDSSVVEWLPSK